MALALGGIKVVEVSQVAAVPMAARYLADFGADVIHIEHPIRGDWFRTAGKGTGGAPSGINYVWENYNRNKRSITIDVSRESGQQILYKFLEKADVFLSNMRPYELKKYNLEFGTLNRLYPRLIYGNLTGYGQNGPERDLPALDGNSYWSRAGIQHGLSQPGMTGPAFVVGAFGDNIAGMALACGLITALFVRERTGRGQEVYVSLFQTGVFQMSRDIAKTLATGQDCDDWRRKPPEEMVAKAEAAIAPLWDFNREGSNNALLMPYKTKGGREIFLLMGQSDLYWSKFCQAIDRGDLEQDPRFESFEAREKNVSILVHIFDEAFLTKTLDEWKPRLMERGLIFGYNQNYREIIADPQARANDFFVPFDHPTYGRIEVVANPIKLSETPAAIRMPAPELGQHTEEVLLEYGYTWEDIAQFKEQGVIA